MSEFRAKPSRIKTHGKALGVLLSWATISVVSVFATSTKAEEASVWHQASIAASVPVKILHGIALVESGKKWSDGTYRPWPWTLNSPARGGQFFLTRHAAERELRSLLASGVTNIDVGLMQVNCGYHCSRVADPADLLDPRTNVRVAAEILAEYGRAKGGLGATVGAYHAGLRPSREERSKWYQDQVARRVRGLVPGGSS